MNRLLLFAAAIALVSPAAQAAQWKVDPGKSTLGYAIMGHPGYEVTEGSIELIDADGKSHDVLAMEADERARHGIFLAFQRPMASPGVKMADFLRHAATNVRRPDRKEGEELIPMRELQR